MNRWKGAMCVAVSVTATFVLLYTYWNFDQNSWNLNLNSLNLKPNSWNLNPNSWNLNLTLLVTDLPVNTNRPDGRSLGMALYRMLLEDPLQHTCKALETMQNSGDGAEFLCLDEEWALPKPCLVYSFGINYNWQVEDFLAGKGCDVYTFDPSMTKVADHKRGTSVWFFRTGLGAKNSDDFQARKDRYWETNVPWKLRTLDTLVHQLGHENRTIDLLKIDIEGHEWSVTRQMLDSGVMKHVKQFVVEWHLFKDFPLTSQYEDMLAVLVELQRSGFLSYHRNPHQFNLNWTEFNVQADYRYVNVNYTIAKR